MLTNDGKKISLAKFNEIFDKHSLKEIKRTGYNIKKINPEELHQSQFDRQLDLYTFNNQQHNEHYEWGKKPKDYSSTFNSPLKMTDIRVAYASFYSEDDVYNRKEKVKVNQEVKKVDYTTLYNAIDRSDRKDEKKLLKKMDKKDEKYHQKRRETIERSLNRDEILFEELKKLRTRK